VKWQILLTFCRVFLHVSTGTESLKIDQEKPELLSKTKWYVFMVHGVVLSYEKYIHTKIEANLLKSVAYKTLDIHVPLFNPLLHALFYCKASN